MADGELGELLPALERLDIPVVEAVAAFDLQADAPGVPGPISSWLVSRPTDTLQNIGLNNSPSPGGRGLGGGG